MKIELIAPESGPSRRLRKRRLIRFPQLTMPLLAACTPAGVELHHTDEIVGPVDLDRDADLVAITCNTPAAAHAYRLARQLRARGRRVVLGGPHVTAMPSDALRHADALVIGKGELGTSAHAPPGLLAAGSDEFVGRQAELEQMKHALELARQGYGQVVAAMGEPGVTKSRLFFESGWPQPMAACYGCRRRPRIVIQT